MKIPIIAAITIILLINVGYSYVTFRTISSDYIFISVNDELQEIFSNEPIDQRGIEVKQISDILSKQPGIENSYVMGALFTPAYYAKSNWIAVHFTEGPENDSIENYITRKNWEDWQIHISNSASRPSDRLGIHNPIPDYLIYYPHEQNLDYLKVLSEPTNPKIPANFELLYISQKSGIVLYKIHNNQG